MDQTSSFITYTLIATLVVWGVVVSSRSAQTSARMASGFYVVCILLVIAALAAAVLAVTGKLPRTDSVRLFHRALIFRGWLVIGTAISSTVLMFLNIFGRFRTRITSEAVRAFVASPYLLRGLCLSVSASFLATEIGKLTHDTEMRQFFLDSGYTVRFLYMIIGAEIAGAIGLLIPKTIVPAASGLAVLMLGAIYTHYHNRDPFSDSLEALHLLALLVCVIILGSFRTMIPGHNTGSLSDA